MNTIGSSVMFNEMSAKATVLQKSIFDGDLTFNTISSETEGRKNERVFNAVGLFECCYKIS